MITILMRILPLKAAVVTTVIQCQISKARKINHQQISPRSITLQVRKEMKMIAMETIATVRMMKIPRVWLSILESH
jgi:hypothetical protein